MRSIRDVIIVSVSVLAFFLLLWVGFLISMELSTKRTDEGYHPNASAIYATNTRVKQLNDATSTANAATERAR